LPQTDILVLLLEHLHCIYRDC